jgi:hypothetical protein
MSADSYDYASAIKDVEREMPEAAREIRKYIAVLKSKIVPVVIYEDTEKERI